MPKARPGECLAVSQLACAEVLFRDNADIGRKLAPPWSGTRPVGRGGRSRRSAGPGSRPARGAVRQLAPSVTPARIPGRRRPGDRVRRGDLVGRARVVRRREAPSVEPGALPGGQSAASRAGLATMFRGPAGRGPAPRPRCRTSTDPDLTAREISGRESMESIERGIPAARGDWIPGLRRGRWQPGAGDRRQSAGRPVPSFVRRRGQSAGRPARDARVQRVRQTVAPTSARDPGRASGILELLGQLPAP